MSTQSIAIQNYSRQSRMGFMFPQSFSEAQTIAKTMVESNCIPDWHYSQKNPIASVMMCLQKGIEVGLSPTEAVQKICRINGVLAIWGDAALALCKIAPDYEYCHETYDEENEMAICEVKRKGEPKIIRTFSKRDAETAGLWGKVYKRKSKDGTSYETKGIWSYYPKRMLQMRARGFALRDCFPHILLGLYLIEEFAGKEEIEINPTEQKVIILNSEKKPEQTDISSNVVDSLKAKLKDKNKPAELIEPKVEEENTNSANSNVDDGHLAETVDLEPKVCEDTIGHLAFLIAYCNVEEKRIEEWWKKANVPLLSELKERQAQAIIQKLEKENSQARNAWLANKKEM